MDRIITGITLAALLTSTAAFAQSSGGADAPANSGPGVQGAPDTRTGPSTKAPGGAAVKPSQSDAGSSGSSSGADGSNSTQPSQDSSGVKGAPGSTAGPTEVSPKSAAESAKHAP